MAYYNFQTNPNREDTNAEKYTLKQQLFGTDDLLPAWVADMDIETPPFVLEAVQKRLAHSIVGYEEMPKSAFEMQCRWMQKQHNLAISTDNLLYSHSVVASMRVAIEAFSQKGDGVVVFTPVYPPFFHSVIELERKLVSSALKQDSDGRYSFDMKDFRSKIDADTKLLLLCSPHNPVGRVWSKEELEEILQICKEKNIVVFADEIHSDLVFAPHKHTPFCSLVGAKELCVTAIGVGKTFNMAGFAISSVLIEDVQLKERFTKAYNRVHFAQGSVLSHVAFESAYKEGEEWLEQLKEHLWGNYLRLRALCEEFEDLVKLTPLEGTYLAWLDCRGMGLRDKKLREFFVKEAKLGLSAGISFSREGSGFMRLNFGVSYDTMTEILYRLENGLRGF